MRADNRMSKGMPEVLMKNLSVGLALIVGIGLLGICSCAKPAASEPYEEMVVSVMDYIKQNHPDAAPFIKQPMSWTVTSPVIKYGYTRCTYTGDGWTVTIGHAATVEVVHEVTAEYNAEEIVWVGTIKDDAITEKSYTKK